MKKILMMLLCAATVALVGCNNNNNDPEPEPDSEQQFDQNGEADWEVRFYTTDTFLLYTNYSIKDSLNPSLDCSQTTVQKLDTHNKADSAMWTSHIRAFGIPVSQVRVIVLPVHLKVGDHCFKITFTRNETPFVTQTVGHFITKGAYLTTTNSKVSYIKTDFPSSYTGDVENLDELFPILLREWATSSYYFSFKMYR